MLTSLVMFGFRAKFWAKDLGWGIKNAAYLYTILQLGQFLSSFIGGFLGDFFQRRFGDKGRIALFQIYCVAFAAMTFIAFPVKFSRGQYYVVAFMLGLVFSIGFSGCAADGGQRGPDAAVRHRFRRPVQPGAGLPDGPDEPGHRLDVGELRPAAHAAPLRDHPLPDERRLLVRLRFHPKDVALRDERTRLVEAGQF